MKMKAQSRQTQTVRQLLGLALVGVVLWLVAIGWLPVKAANAAPGAPPNDDPEKGRVRMQTQLNLTAEKVDQT